MCIATGQRLRIQSSESESAIPIEERLDMSPVEAGWVGNHVPYGCSPVFREIDRLDALTLAGRGLQSLGSDDR